VVGLVVCRLFVAELVCKGLVLICLLVDDADGTEAVAKKQRPNNAAEEMVRLQQVVETHKEDIAVLQNTVATKDHTIKELQTQVQESEFTAESLQLTVQNNLVELKELKQANSRLDNSLASAKKEITILRSDIQKLVASGPINIKTGKQVVLGVAMQCGHFMELEDFLLAVRSDMFVAHVIEDQKSAKKNAKLVQLTINMNHGIRCAGCSSSPLVQLNKVEPFLNPNAQYWEANVPELKQNLFVSTKPAINDKGDFLYRSIVSVICPHCKKILQPAKAIAHLSECPSLTVKWEDIMSVFQKDFVGCGGAARLNQATLVLNMRDPVDAFMRVANFAIKHGADAHYGVTEGLVWSPFDFLVHFLVINKVINVVQSLPKSDNDDDDDEEEEKDIQQGQNLYEEEYKQSPPIIAQDIKWPDVDNLVKEIPWLKHEPEKINKMLLFPFFARRIIAKTAYKIDESFRGSVSPFESMLAPLYQTVIKEHNSFVATLVSMYCTHDAQYRNFYSFIDSDNDDHEDEDDANAVVVLPSSSASSPVAEDKNK